ncbi:MAG TPA: hypothetical protein VLK82_27085 [Candidatus Tectomicrobia bacterium]|nr:hypothetical protein [Candidatus Tectomicrobia bacterium]
MSVRRLASYFGGWKVSAITTTEIRKDAPQRQSQGAANASINWELAVLKRMFNLAHRAEIIPTKPYVPLLRENHARAGFFEAEAFSAVHRRLPGYLKPVAVFGYVPGWRKQESLGLEWRQVDLQAGTVRLDPGTTKNRKGRIIPWVFHRQGEHRRDFKEAWRTACKRAGQPGMLFRDLRRTAVRNVVRAAIPEQVAM